MKGLVGSGGNISASGGGGGGGGAMLEAVALCLVEDEGLVSFLPVELLGVVGFVVFAVVVVLVADLAS